MMYYFVCKNNINLFSTIGVKQNIRYLLPMYLFIFYISNIISIVKIFIKLINLIIQNSTYPRVYDVGSCIELYLICLAPTSCNNSFSTPIRFIHFENFVSIIVYYNMIL